MIIEKIKSKVDNVTKYIFEYHDGGKFKVEFSYIDNGTNKDIICIPTQTMCNMSCSFCYLTKYVGDIKVKDINPLFISHCIAYISNDIGFHKKILLFSFMASGEPLSTPCIRLPFLMNDLREKYEDKNPETFRKVRFALATILPKNKKNYISFVQEIVDNKLDVKLHLSTHFSDDKIREENMPNALNLADSISFLSFYKRFTGNEIEIHYTLIKGLNDSKFDMVRLRDLLNPVKDFVTLKFMKLKSDDKSKIIDEKGFLEMIEKTPSLQESLRKKIEYYDSVGEDIGSSCGQFFIK